MKRCSNLNENLARCPCSYEPCGKKGMCCECLRYHLSMKQLPACCFSKEDEKSYDRSFANFIKTHASHQKF